MQRQVFITDDYTETQKVAADFAKELKGGETLALYGELGSGKTTFVQGLAKGLGIKRRIISPTFIIVRTYKISIKYFYHIDLYRIENVREVRSLGLEEIMNDQNSIVAIEWAEKMGDLLPKERIDIHFKYVDESKRKIAILQLSS